MSFSPQLPFQRPAAQHTGSFSANGSAMSGTMPHTSQASPFAVPSQAPSGQSLHQAVVVVSDGSMPIYQQMVNVIQLRQQPIVDMQPHQVHAGMLSEMGLLVLACGQHDPTPWLKSLTQHLPEEDWPPMVAVISQWRDDIAVNLFDSGVQDILVAPVPDVYLAARLLLALEAGAEKKQLQQAYRVLSAHRLRSHSGVWSPDGWKAIAHQWFADGLGFSVSMVRWQTDRMSPQMVQHLENAIVQLCRAADIVGTDTTGRLITVLPSTDEQACHGFLQRIHESVPGLQQGQYQMVTLQALPNQWNHLAGLLADS